MSDIIFTDTQRAVNQTKGREIMGRDTRKTCDFEQCKMNIDSLCTATKDVQCPKNNSQSVYENPELLKRMKSKIKKPEKKEAYKPTDKQVGEGAYYYLREIKGYNEAIDKCEAFRKQELTELADEGNIKETLLSIYDMEGGTAKDIAKEISAMIKEKL